VRWSGGDDGVLKFEDLGDSDDMFGVVELSGKFLLVFEFGGIVCRRCWLMTEGSRLGRKQCKGSCVEECSGIDEACCVERRVLLGFLVVEAK